MNIAAMEMIKLCVVFYCMWLIPVFACPDSCTCSNKHVDCNGKQLRNIPHNIPTDTMKLDLSNNQIERINSSQFMNLETLRELVLTGNQLTSLEVGTFKYLKNLENLNLGTNNIKVLAAGVFDGMSKLKGIDLTENFIQNINDAFQNLQMLERLDLGNNKIKTINGMAFNDLKNLIYLVLPKNEITKIDRFALRPLQKLSSVILSKNPLKNANALFVKNRQLSYIDLTDCALTRIPAKFPPSIQYLQLRNNNITRIKKFAFSKNKLLGILVLDHNKISFIEKGAFGPLKVLQELWLNSNNLMEFPSPVSPSIKSIYISKNKIQRISRNNFPANSQLKILSLKTNKISSLEPGTFSQLKQLDKLYLDQNKISVLKNKTFSELNKLSVLSLSKNFITRIEADVFKGLQNLIELEMAFVPEMVPPTKIEGNMFSNIQNLTALDLQLSPTIGQEVVQSNMLSSATKMRKINLMDNNLKTMNPEIQTFLKNADIIKIAGNVWHCDERLLFLKKWMNSNLKKFFLNSQIICSSPDSLRGKRISMLSDDDFVPVTSFPQQTTNTPTTITTTTQQPKKKAKDQTEQKVGTTLKVGTTIKVGTTVKVGTTLKVGTTVKVHTTLKAGTTVKVYTRKLYIKTKSTTKTLQKSTVSAKTVTTTKLTKLAQTTRNTGVTTPTVNIINTTESRKGSTQMTGLTNQTDKDVLASSPTEPSTSDDRNSTSFPSITGKHKIDEMLTVEDKTYSYDTTYESKTGQGSEKSFNENGRPRNRSGELDSSIDGDKTKVSGSDGNTKIIIIATCVSVATLIGIILITVFVHRLYKKNKLVYHRALQYRQEYSNVTFFVGEPVNAVAETDIIAKPKPRKRSDRGSTSSVTKEDITNELDQSMKVYTWDDEN